MGNKAIVFFIGTTAEYIKLFPIIEAVKKTGAPYRIITSGQNAVEKTDIAREFNLKVDVNLSLEEDIVKNVFGLFFWFFKTTAKAKRIIKKETNDLDRKKSIMVVHGDTLSTVMGAVTAKRLGMKLAHVEAGLRSHKLFSPFPEEIDRLTVSRLADFNFCQSAKAAANIKRTDTKVINTEFNTIIDSIKFAENAVVKNNIVASLKEQDYGVFVVHRQENLLRKGWVQEAVSKAIEISNTHKIVFIMHQITEDTLKKLGLYNALTNAKNIIVTKRMEYFDFMQLLINSSFVITDGGSNQEELSYMGVPTLILRSATERDEGIGENAKMYEENLDNINVFLNELERYKRPAKKAENSPSQIICNMLAEYVVNNESEQ